MSIILDRALNVDNPPSDYPFSTYRPNNWTLESELHDEHLKILSLLKLRVIQLEPESKGLASFVLGSTEIVINGFESRINRLSISSNEFSLQMNHLMKNFFTKN